MNTHDTLLEIHNLLIMFRHRVVTTEQKNFWTEAERLAQTAETLADDNETLLLAGKQPMAQAQRMKMARRLKKDADQLLTKVRHATAAELRTENPLPRAVQPSTTTRKTPAQHATTTRTTSPPPTHTRPVMDLWTALTAARTDPSTMTQLLQDSWLGGTWNRHPRLTGVSVHDSQAGVGVTLTCHIRGSKSVNGHLEILVTRRGNLADILLRPVVPKGGRLYPETVRGTVETFRHFDNVGNFYFDPSQWIHIQAADVVTDLHRHGFQTKFLEGSKKYLEYAIDDFQTQNMDRMELYPEITRLRKLFTESCPSPQDFAENKVLPAPFCEKILAHLPIAIQWSL